MCISLFYKKVRKQENMLSTKKTTRRKGKKKENTLSTKKAIKKKEKKNLDRIESSEGYFLAGRQLLTISIF